MQMQRAREKPAGQATQAPDFESFFKQEYERLMQAMVLVTGGRADAEDLAQEAMARLYERWRHVRSADSPAAYLYRTAFNLNVKRVRRLAIRRRKDSMLPSPTPADDPADLVASRSDILRALRSLPRTQVEALVLVEWLDLPADEAGRVLGIEPSSVRGRVHRARRSLRERFGGVDADDP